MTEWQECMLYLHFPKYVCSDPRDYGYMGGFHIGMFKQLVGFQRILTLIARRYLFHTATGTLAEGDPYSRIEYARKALLAWCSVVSDAKCEPKVCFAELHDDFPELVTKTGNGWLIRHFQHIVKMIRNDEDELFDEKTVSIYNGLSRGFKQQWKNKVQQMQVPIFQTNTKAAWGLRFDDILAEALDAGPLRTEPIVLPEKLQARLAIEAEALSPRMLEVTEAVLRYLYANRQPDTEWVVFPVCNFNARWGTESFEKKWKSKIPTSLVAFQTCSGSLARAKIVNMEKYL